MRSTKASPAKSSITESGSRSRSAEVSAELPMHIACTRHLTRVPFAELVEMLVWERDKIMTDGPGRDLSDLNLGSDESSSAVLNVRLHTVVLRRAKL